MATATTTIDKQINSYLVRLNAKEKEAVLSVVKTFAENRQEDEPWGDKTFVAEMDRRFNEMENGKVKSYTLDEAETHARRAYKDGKRKR
jgi:hypothetical protein